MISPRLSGLVAASLVSACLLPRTALAFSETFVHLRADPAALKPFVLDLYDEDAEFRASFVETLPVEEMALVIQIGGPKGLTREDLAGGDKGILVELRVHITPSEVRSENANLFGNIFCRPSTPPEGYKTNESGLLCLSVYDAGDAGEFFIVPEFAKDGRLTAADVHFSVVSQRVSDHQGTPDGDPFVGALLNGRDVAVDQSVADYNEFFANARPIVRLKSVEDSVVLRFADAPQPSEDP